MPDSEPSIDVVFEQIRNLNDNIRRIESDFRKDTEKLESALEKRYVTHDKFEPVRMIAYGTVGVLLTAVLLAIMTAAMQVAK